MIAAMDRALWKALDKHQEVIDAALRDAGCTPLPSFELSAQPRRVDFQQWDRPGDKFRLAVARLEHIAATVPKDVALEFAGLDSGDVYRFADIQAEIGCPGTAVIRGGTSGKTNGMTIAGVRAQLNVEQNGALLPFLVRGSYGSPALFEDMYRRDPSLYKHTNDHAAMMVAATYEPGVPEDADDELRAIIKQGHRSIMNVKGGWDAVANNNATFIRNGFAVNEIVWQDKGGFTCPYKIGFRDQSSVEYWIFDENQNDLVGAEFRVSSGGQWKNYVLPHGDTKETARLWIVNVGASGNNVEGVPAYRPISGYFKLKTMLLALYGVAWQKHGVPIAIVFTEIIDQTIGEMLSIGSAEHKAEKQKMITRLQNMRAKIAPVIPAPGGVDVKYVSPTNDMPDMEPMLRYLDFSMALAFSNEGALLGTQTGSYALAASKENSLLRGGSAYCARMAAALDQLMRWIIDFNYSKADELVEYPKYSFRFAGSLDTSTWVDDLVKGLPLVPSMPEEARRQFAAGLGLPSNSFDALAQPQGEEVAQADAGQAEAPGAVVGVNVEGDVADTALNGAQVTALVDIIVQVSAGVLPRDSGIAALQRAYQLDEAQASALMGSAGLDFKPEPPVATSAEATEVS